MQDLSLSYFLQVPTMDLKALSADQVFAPENFGGNGFGFEEYSEPNFRYLANSILNAAYLQIG